MSRKPAFLLSMILAASIVFPAAGQPGKQATEKAADAPVKESAGYAKWQEGIQFAAKGDVVNALSLIHI